MLKKKDMMNNGIMNFFKSDVSIIEKKVIIIKEKNVKIKCLEKKK